MRFVDLKTLFRPSFAKLKLLSSFLESYSVYNSFSNFYDKNANALYKKSFNEGLNKLAEFTNYPYIETNKLIQAAKKFSEANLIHPTTAEPYICLAWLYFIAEDHNMVREYLSKAEELNSKLPFISNLRFEVESLSLVS